MTQDLVKKNILGIDVSDVSKDDVLEYVFERIKNGKKKTIIVTPNPEMVVYARSHPDIKKLLNSADLALCDGIGLYLASQIIGRGVKDRITGVDMLDALCREASEKAVTVGFLGGKGSVAERTANCLMEKYPGLKVVFVAEEWGEEGFVRAKRLMINEYRLKNNKEEIINQIDILFVAFGFPKQEQWIAEHRNKLPIKVAMGVGGAFDYLSGEVIRAPFVIRMMGFEWLFRLIRQPWRIKRQLRLLTFLWLVIKEKSRVE